MHWLAGVLMCFLLPKHDERHPMVHMRKCLFIVAVLAFSLKLSAADTNAPAQLKIGTADATSYYNQIMVVTGKVAQVTIRPSVIFLNLDRPYPDSPFTVVIFPGKFIADLTALKGRAVEIKGPIKKYHDKPEIVLDNTNQLTVLGAPISISMGPINAPAVPKPAAVPPAAPSTNLPEIM
jgi:hypothetical protein